MPLQREMSIGKVVDLLNQHMKVHGDVPCTLAFLQLDPDEELQARDVTQAPMIEVEILQDVVAVRDDKDKTAHLVIMFRPADTGKTS